MTTATHQLVVAATGAAGALYVGPRFFPALAEIRARLDVERTPRLVPAGGDS